MNELNEMNEMNEQRMTVSTLAEGAAEQILRNIALRVSDQFEAATEYGLFENDEDDIVADLMLRLYRAGRYAEAVQVMRLAFSMVDATDAVGLLSVVHSTIGTEAEKKFLEAFIACSPRCEMAKIRRVIEGHTGEEV